MTEYRGYRIMYKDFSMLVILNLGKGAIPKSLSGNFTSHVSAKAAIDAHLDSK